MPQPFGFTGELHAGGLVYLRARWYDGSAGTFTQRDPFGGFPEQPYSLHPYQYGYANPGRWTDASGYFAPAIVLGGALVGGASVALAGLIVLPVAVVGSVYAFSPEARHDLARGAAVAYAYPVEAISILTGWSTAEEVFGPPHTGHTGGVPTDLMPYGPPPTSVQLPPLPILGDLTPPSDRACFDQLPGTSLFPVSWEEYILPHPLPDPQTATVLQIYIQSDGSMGAMFDPANAEKPVKLGYSEYLGQTPPTGITWLDEGMWVSAGLASFENSAKFWLTFGEAIKNTETINFVIDGMDVFNNPERMRGDAVTHDEMDAIISGGYTPKLHLWQEGKELKGRERLQWIREWRKMRGL